MPKFEEKTDVLKNIKPLVRKPAFVVFMLFVILAGSFDGVVASYIFV